MKHYWFWIQPFTFIFQTKKEVLFYNSETGYSWMERLTSSIKRIVEKLQKHENSYCISLSETDLNDKKINQLVGELRNSFSGDLIEQDRTKGKPFVFKPKLRLINDVEIIRKEKDRGIGDSVLQFISEVFIYLNSACSQNCPDCSRYYKQFFYCRSQKDEEDTLNLNKLIRFLEKIETAGVMKIVFSGGNIFSSSKMHLLIENLSERRFRKIIQFNYLNYPDDNLLRDFRTYVQFEILVHFPVQYEILEKTLILLDETNTNWKFIVRSEEEYLAAAQIIKMNDLNAEIKPFYNGQNIDFFKKYVYVEKEDLKLTTAKKSIFARGKINENDFGKLTIMPDGKVYANLYHAPLGTIDDDIRELIYNEMDRGTSWRRIRNMNPCCDCVYQWLCPSPSNYELAIGKPNLCHIKP